MADPVYLTITQGDRLTLPTARLTDSVGNYVNLVGQTVAFRMVEVNTGVTAVSSQAALVLQNTPDATTWGRVRYVWQAGETDTPGLYQAWFIATSSGLTQHYPVDGSLYILITPSP